MTKTEELLLSVYKKPRLNFTEICHAIGIAVTTGYALRSKQTFPITLSGSPRSASVVQVAAYLDKIDQEAVAETV